MSDTPLPPAIVTTNLTKRYGSTVAANAVSLSVPETSIYGFLGPNGAGKTTTIRMLLGFITPSAGSATVFGFDTQSEGVRSRENLGYLVPSESFYPQMRGRDQLDFAARLSNRQPVLRQHALDLLELSDKALGQKLQSYSKGMKQKLALVAAVQHDPRLLILDEPTDGLDPLIRRRFEEFLQEFRGRGRTIFMSSHDLSEVERVCDSVAVIRDGFIIAEQTVDELKRYHRQRLNVTFRSAIPAGLETMGSVEHIDPVAHTVSLLVEADVNDLIATLRTESVEEISITPPSLDDIFLAFYDENDKDPDLATPPNLQAKR